MYESGYFVLCTRVVLTQEGNVQHWELVGSNKLLCTIVRQIVPRIGAQFYGSNNSVNYICLNVKWISSWKDKH